MVTYIATGTLSPDPWRMLKAKLYFFLNGAISCWGAGVQGEELSHHLAVPLLVKSHSHVPKPQGTLWG